MIKNLPIFILFNFSFGMFLFQFVLFYPIFKFSTFLIGYNPHSFLKPLYRKVPSLNISLHAPLLLNASPTQRHILLSFYAARYSLHPLSVTHASIVNTPYWWYFVSLFIYVYYVGSSAVAANKKWSFMDFKYTGIAAFCMLLS